MAGDLSDMDSIEQLREMLCCCGDDHTVKAGGRGINIVQTKWLAKWPFLAAVNVLIPQSHKYPLAAAVVCDRCITGKLELKYVVAGEPDGQGEARYWRVAVSELEEPAVYWPDLHPDRVRQGVDIEP